MRRTQPPKLFQRFFKWYCKDLLHEQIMGDIEEQFDEDLKRLGKFRAKLRYALTVLRFFQPEIIKPMSGTRKLNFYGMLKHNLLISFRGFKRYKTTFVINLIGLSTGIASALFIFLWVSHELSVDKFPENEGSLYRVMSHFQLPNNKVTWEYTSGRMAQSMKADYPEIIESTRVNNKFFVPKGVVSTEKTHTEVIGQFADPNVFSVLSYDVIIGNPANAIQAKNAVAISKNLATSLFGSPENAMGKTLQWDSDLFNDQFIVTGVFNPPPKSATRQFDLVINYEKLIDADKWANEWNGGYAEVYVVLREDVNVETFNTKIAGYYDDKVGNEKFTIFLQKYSDRYLYDHFEDGQLIGGRISSVRLFSYIAIFILLIAAINFINLSTAQASTKLKEIGVKKAMGSGKSQLIFQFLTESILMSLIANIAAIGIVFLLLPSFNQLVALELIFDPLRHWLLIIASGVGLGLLAGIYPAFYLSSFRPVSIMKGKLPSMSGERWLRKGLVIMQFCLSVIFIVGMLVVNGQLNFVQNKPLGYNRNNLLLFEGKGSERVDPSILISAIDQIPGVINATNMAGAFLWGNDNSSGYIWGDDNSNRNYLFKSPKIGYNTIETLELEMIAGRSFDPAFNDTNERIILNESAVKMMGLENPVGQKLRSGNDEYKEIIGVVKDFQYGSLHQSIEPLIFRFREWGRNYIVRLQPGSELRVLEAIENAYLSTYPKYTFESRFLQDDYLELYSSEHRLGRLSSYFAFFAILISSLGLLGLVTFSTQRRIKEIGIRKVLGCPVPRIVFLLSWDFTKMVIVAIIIAVPLSYTGLSSWLQTFAYHIQLSWWYFGVGGAIALIIAWTITSTKTIRAATSNPVEALKDE